jgi:hypothetical protein
MKYIDILDRIMDVKSSVQDLEYIMYPDLL